MQYENFPPIENFLSVLKSFPEISYVYIQLWILKDKNGNMIFHKSEIVPTFLISPTIFTKFLFKLTNLKLITYTFRDQSFSIEML